MRVVNTSNEEENKAKKVKNEFKTYQSEGRIIESPELFYKFMMTSLRIAESYKSVLLNEKLLKLTDDPNISYYPKSTT